MINPATGTLEIGSDLRPKVERALRRKAYIFAFRMYLRLPRIDFRFFLIECREAQLRVLRNFPGDLQQFAGYRHHRTPR